MASNYVCKLCGLGSPPFFSLSSSGKVPLCASDLGKFISAQGAGGHTILPIEAMNFVQTVEDVPAYNQRTGDMKQCEERAGAVMQREGEDFQRAVRMVKELKETAVGIVEAECDQLLGRMVELHTGVVAGLVAAMEEFGAGKATKEMRLGEVAQAVAQWKPTVDRPFAHFSNCVQSIAGNCFNSVRAVLQNDVGRPTAVILSHVKGSIGEVAVPRKRPASSDKPPAAASSPKKVRKTNLLCPNCEEVLTEDNSISLDGHEQCRYCLECVAASPETCPGCQRDYSPANCRQLQACIPGFAVSTIPSKPSYPQCFQCHRSKKVFHYCAGKPFCNACCEQEISEEYSGSATCRRCGFDPFSAEGAELRCFLCRRKKTLSQIVHTCVYMSRLCRVCDRCKVAATEQGKCILCGKELDVKSATS